MCKCVFAGWWLPADGQHKREVMWKLQDEKKIENKCALPSAPSQQLFHTAPRHPVSGFWLDSISQWRSLAFSMLPNSKCLSCKIALGPRHYDFSRWCSFCSPLRTSTILSPTWFECLSHVRTIARLRQIDWGRFLKARAIFCSKDRVVLRDTSDSSWHTKRTAVMSFICVWTSSYSRSELRFISGCTILSNKTTHWVQNFWHLWWTKGPHKEVSNGTPSLDLRQASVWILTKRCFQFWFLHFQET